MGMLNNLTLAEAQAGLAKGDFSSRELTESHIEAIEIARDLNIFVTETPERALADAEASDKRRITGQVGALDGLPIAIKDLFCTRGIKSTASSHMLESFVPPYESTVTAKMLEAGMVMLGKTNLDEFAMGSSNETSFFGPVINPWKRNSDNKALVPGGSSGGSAAAVAARLCLAATGTDTGGSIRQPASFCVIVGMKPTYGRCSRWGIVAFASSLDQAGPLTRTVRDAAIVLQTMVGFDPKDTTSADAVVPDFQAMLGQDIKGMKIGIPSEYRIEGTDPEILALWEQGIKWLEDAGAEAIEVTLPRTKYALPAYYIIAPAEASSNLARYDGMRYGLRVDGDTLSEVYENTRGEGFGDEVRRRILMGTYVLSAGYYDAYYIKAQKVRKLIADEFSVAFETVDAILTPSVPSAAFGHGEKSDDLLGMYLNDVMTVPASLAGLPSISVPAGLSSDGLPLGLQLITKAFDEGTLFRVAEILEQSAGFTAQPGQKA